MRFIKKIVEKVEEVKRIIFNEKPPYFNTSYDQSWKTKRKEYLIKITIISLLFLSTIFIIIIFIKYLSIKILLWFILSLVVSVVAIILIKILTVFLTDQDNSPNPLSFLFCGLFILAKILISLIVPAIFIFSLLLIFKNPTDIEIRKIIISPASIIFIYIIILFVYNALNATIFSISYEKWSKKEIVIRTIVFFILSISISIGYTYIFYEVINTLTLDFVLLTLYNTGVIMNLCLIFGMKFNEIY